MELTHAGDVGYILCAPMICDFLFWFHNRVQQLEIRNIWFSARDGYLLHKMYDRLGEQTGVYFLTSRIAAIRAGMENITDIAYVDSMKFFGTQEENLRVRFGLDIEEKMEKRHESEMGLLRYADDILDKTRVQCRNYGLYVEQFELKDGAIAFFDFVAKGTTQMYVQKLTEHPLKGLYFLQLEPEFMKDKGLDIEPFYSKEETDNSAIFDHYYILETILTAPHPQVLEFDENGKPVYAKETRSRKDIQCFDEMQKGIMDYFNDYLMLVSKDMHQENKALDEKILELIHGLKIIDENFLSLEVEDPFFNRMTAVRDLLD